VMMPEIRTAADGRAVVLEDCGHAVNVDHPEDSTR
jgi:pimeloyl-ACP methyl ester carboxylesterase